MHTHMYTHIYHLHIVCLTLCDTMNWRLLMGFSRQEYWSAISSRGSYRPRDKTWISYVSCVTGVFLPMSHWESHIYTHTHTHTHTYTHIHTYIHTHIHTYTHTDIDTHTHRHTHTHTHTDTHTYTCTYTHTHTHTKLSLRLLSYVQFSCV